MGGYISSVLRDMLSGGLHEYINDNETCVLYIRNVVKQSIKRDSDSKTSYTDPEQGANKLQYAPKRKHSTCSTGYGKRNLGRNIDKRSVSDYHRKCRWLDKFYSQQVVRSAGIVFSISIHRNDNLSSHLREEVAA